MNNSVLNTDFFDRRRYSQIFSSSPKLQELEESGRDSLPFFSDLMGDIWASLYKAKPALKEEELHPSLLLNQVMMDRLLSTDPYSEFRTVTKLDDLAAAIGSLQLTETVSGWLMDKRKQDERFAALLSQLADLSSTEAGEADPAQVDALQGQLRDLLQQDQLTPIVRNAGQKIKEVREDVGKLINGTEPGNQPGVMNSVPLEEKIRLAEQLIQQPNTAKKLREIMAWAGRFQVIAKKKQRSKTTDTATRAGVVTGNDLEHVLPSELSLLSHPATRMEFYRRYAEGQLLQYEKKHPEPLGKGPIIFCLDQSASMKKLDTMSKGFMLACATIAKKQRRDFAYIPFDTYAEDAQIFGRGKISAQEIMRIATEFRNGGTKFQAPLEKALLVAEQHQFKNADIVFITDGDDNKNSWFHEVFMPRKQEKELRVLSISFGDRNEKREIVLNSFSDKVVWAEDFTDANAHAAFDL